MTRLGLITFVVIILSAAKTQAQAEDSTQVEEDFSVYADAEMADGIKRYCTSKVFDQSPNKLISIGYDFQGNHTMSLAAFGESSARDMKVRSVQGVRLAASFPVVSRTDLLINLGFNYAEAHYETENSERHVLARSLERGLRTTGLSAVVFKPLNEKNFLLFQFAADLNGDYYLPDFQSLNLTRYSGSILYGWKKHDRLLYGFGLSRTYRIGEMNYVPAILYNYTFPSRKWGVEAAFPARVQMRRNFSARSLAFFGYELEGQSYRISSLRGVDNVMNPELRRSELRIRATFERSLKDFIWLSAQVGVRYNWSFNLDDGDFFRGFTGNDPFVMENDLTTALYFNVSINLVSP